MDSIERARAYLRKLPASVEKSGGRPALFKAARVLAFSFDLAEQEALPLLSEFNARCLPPFTDRELRETLACAKKSSRGERGRLNKVRSPYATSYRPTRPASDAPRGLSGPTLRQIIEAKKEADEIARQRAAFPTPRIPSDDELRTISDLRGNRYKVSETAAVRRLLMTCTYDGHECLAMCGRGKTFMQVKRLDGSKIPVRGKLEKVKTLFGSRGSWIDEIGAMDGATVIPAGFPVIIVEGVIGILEAMEARMRADDLSKRNVRAWIIARVSANHSATATLLASLYGRKVRIIADNDDSGSLSASELHVRIKAAGGFPEIVSPEPKMIFEDQPKKDLGEPPIKDLGNSLKAFPPDHQFWLDLFTF